MASGVLIVGLAACGAELAPSPGGVPAASHTAAVRPVASFPAGFDPGGPIIPAGGAARLCASVSGITRLVASPFLLFPQDRLHPAPPGGFTVTGARARSVAAALCALPAMPAAPVNCPADHGTGYRLSFAAGPAAFPAVTVQTSGCARVTGAGPTRWVARTPGFWAVLHQAIGAPEPTGPALP